MSNQPTWQTWRDELELALVSDKPRAWAFDFADQLSSIDDSDQSIGIALAAALYQIAEQTPFGDSAAQVAAEQDELTVCDGIWRLMDILASHSR